MKTKTTPSGLYEILVTDLLKRRMERRAEPCEVTTVPLRPAEAADRIAFHLSRVIQQVVESEPADTRAVFGIDVARALVHLLSTLVGDDAVLIGDMPVDPGLVLQAITGRLPDGTAEQIAQPYIPLLDTTLLTNAPDEPRVGSQLAAEIH